MSNGLHSSQRGMLRRFAGDKRANVAIIFGISIIPLTFLIGMTIDYSRAAWRQTQLDAAADAAVLSALTPGMLKTSPTDAQLINQATNVFNAQVQSIPGINYSASNLSVTVSDSGISRTLTLTYAASSQNAFASVLGQATIALTGKSQATSSVPPNIDFYVLLDNSPSMAIAATTSGINTMVANTPDQCAFGCHESDTSPNDRYALARSLGVSLRMDLVAQATQNLTTTAQQTMNTNNNQYRMAIYTFNIGFNTIQTLTSSMSTAQASAGGITIYEVPCQNCGPGGGDPYTNYDNAMSSINAAMPNPGNGTQAPGDKPQEVMFFVTDGVEDEWINNSRKLSLMSNSWCSTIKNRGIRIAVLYTEYLPLPTNNYYNQNIAAWQPQIGPNLQSCASPGLYFKVTTNGDISAAMSALFQEAVATAHLTQ
jgi:Flp pilus assembly protein TadG